MVPITGDHNESYSAPRAVLSAVEMSLWSPSDCPKMTSKNNQNGKPSRDVLSITGCFPRPLSHAFNFPKVCTKFRAIGIVLKISSWVILIRTHQYGRIEHHVPSSLAVMIILGLTLWGQETEAHQYGHLHGPYWAKRVVPLTVSLASYPDPNFNEGYFWYSTYFKITLQVTYYPFW